MTFSKGTDLPVIIDIPRRFAIRSICIVAVVQKMTHPEISLLSVTFWRRLPGSSSTRRDQIPKMTSQVRWNIPEIFSGLGSPFNWHGRWWDAER